MLNPKNEHSFQKVENEVQREGHYIEILGDTVSSKQLIISILLSVAVSIGGYKIGQYVFPKIAEAQMVNSYSLLLGIAGTIIILIINTILFKPKRILIEDETSNGSMEGAFKDLQLDIDDELRLIDEDPVTRKELENLGVLSQFENMRGVNKK